MSEVKKQVLGRGLSSLLGEAQDEIRGTSVASPLELPVVDIEPGVNQPRHSFSEDELEALSISIKEKGVLQPILVRASQTTGKYEIVAGERRWRAAKLANLEFIPALIREFSDAEALEVGLLENLQRQDLDPIDEASGYRRLAEEFNHTQETLSRIVGKSRSHIANTLRLLTLPGKIQIYLKEGQLSAGHGRAILSSEDPEGLADIIIERTLNVRQAEALARKNTTHQRSKTFSSRPSTKMPDRENEIITGQLSVLLGVPLYLHMKEDARGEIVIPFKNAIELDHILQTFDVLATKAP